MHFIPEVDYFLLAFLALNIFLIFFSAPVARSWLWLQRACSPESQQRELQKWFAADDIARWRDLSFVSKTVFWTGFVNGFGLVFVRVFLIPLFQ